jgi:serine/threonine protein kinase
MHKNSGKIYAIKTIALNNKELEKAFKELKLIKELKSRYVVDHIDSWIEEKLKFEEIINENESFSNISSNHTIFNSKKTILLHIQMEFCSQTLNDLIKILSNELSKNNSPIMKTMIFYTCCELLTEIIESVNFLHGRNVIHRDLKPANILVSDGINGRFVKLADFGLSVIHEFIDQSHTQASGTMKYMAPEVIDSRKYDMKADIFSLGKIVEELFLFNSEM